jgi:hypothetical protein
MLSPHVLDERFEFSSTAPRGGELRHNLYDRLALGAPVDERSLTFMEHTGYGVSFYDIPYGALKITDPVEMAARIAAVLPVTTSYDTLVTVMRRTRLMDHTANTESQDDAEYVLVVWGSGYNPQRVERLDELRRACESRGPGLAARVRTVAHLEQCQGPLIEQSESYRAEVPLAPPLPLVDSVSDRCMCVA